MSTTKTIALCLLLDGRDKLTAPEITCYAAILGVSTRQIYRYLAKIAEAKFYIKDIAK